MFNNLLLRWWLFFCVLLLGLVALYNNGVLVEVYKADSTYMCMTIFAILGYATLHCGIAAGKVNTTVKKCEKVIGFDNSLHKDYIHDLDANVMPLISRCSFLATICSSLGMFGTIWGMIQMMKSISGINLDDVNLVDFASSMGIALYTTLVGLFCRMLIRIQVHGILEQKQRLDHDAQTYD